MDREIKFRGKSLEAGKWLYGSLITGILTTHDDGDIAHIIESNKLDDDFDCWEDLLQQLDEFEVDPKTIGQYTGVGDHFHNKIFAGDIVDYENMLTSNAEPFTGTVIFDEGSWWVVNEEELKAVPLWGEANYLRIKGNIYDNPELLEVNK